MGLGVMGAIISILSLPYLWSVYIKDVGEEPKDKVQKMKAHKNH